MNKNLRRTLLDAIYIKYIKTVRVKRKFMCFFEKKGSNMRQVSFSLLFCLWDFFLMGLIFLIGPIKFCDMGLFMGLKLFDLKWDCFFLWSTYFVILKVKTFKRDCTSIFKIYLVGFLNFLSRPEVRRICYFFMQIWETCVFMCVCFKIGNGTYK